ncbi:Gfo/Idh/MocA family oxidoreductase [Pendulispora rubella]|uniref:Gfo/Idh/MocA family oxidoreductase n=1 Tax=Pendulispora rubella TaxID=2741070 RepID=A0ABZ2KVT9_9BACT
MASTRKIRYAVAGAGNIAQAAVLPAFEHAQENSELVAIVSSDPEKREKLAAQYRVHHVGSYDQLESILAQAKIDALYIALPNTMHREFTERAARSKVHVLCEKPMAMTEEDCEAMIRACKKAEVKLMIAYRLHFEEATLRAIELVKNGTLGPVRLFDSSFAQQVRPGDIRTRPDVGGGALFDMGIYCVNAARAIFRDEPEEVFAYQVSHGDGRFRGVDATTVAVLRFPGDRIATFGASQGAAGIDTYRIVGTEGDLRVEPAYTYHDDLTHTLTVGSETRTTIFTKRDQFAPELVAFSRCILEGTEPEPSGEEGLADVRVLRAIVRAAREGRPMKLGPFERAQRPDLRNEIAKPPVQEPKTVNAPSPSLPNDGSVNVSRR